VSTQFKPGDEVIVIGFDLGMNTPGGFGQRIRVPAGWIVPRPAGLPLEQSMILGTAGFTAALAVDKLEASGMRTNGGPVLVTGATGGVGSVAVMLLTHLGYEVAAVTGKAAQHDFLKKLGAKEILGREALLEGANRPMLKERWGGVVDTVGGDILFNAVKSLKYGCSLAACGLVASPQFAATVLPFILRHVNLLGIDSVQLPLAEKARIWNKLAGVWRLDGLAALKVGFTLASISSGVDRILAGRWWGGASWTFAPERSCWGQLRLNRSDTAIGLGYLKITMYVEMTNVRTVAPCTTCDAESLMSAMLVAR
jgi:alcohol dehydrogenase